MRELLLSHEGGRIYMAAAALLSPEMLDAVKDCETGGNDPERSIPHLAS
jgi:hypothetical protein